jgi:hypothetical protein
VNDDCSRSFGPHHKHSAQCGVRKTRTRRSAEELTYTVKLSQSGSGEMFPLTPVPSLRVALLQLALLEQAFEAVGADEWDSIPESDARRHIEGCDVYAERSDGVLFELTPEETWEEVKPVPSKDDPITLPSGRVITRRELHRVALILKDKHRCQCYSHVEAYLNKEAK